MIDAKVLEDKVNELREKYKDYATDGWKWKEIVNFVYDIVESLIHLSQAFFAMSDKEAKKEWVMNTIKEFLPIVKPAIDVPWIPGNYIEYKIFEFSVLNIVPWLIDKMVDTAKTDKDDNFKKAA